ncbi:MAG TPA: hypothetical protein DCO79_10735 [Spirochaeta sp.]|nr:hypothetical protein [Spirochaeta sp.]
MLNKYFGFDIELAMGLFEAEFCGTGGIVLSIGPFRAMLNAGYDVYTEFVILPMIGWEFDSFLLIAEGGYSPEYGGAVGIGGAWLF